MNLFLTQIIKLNEWYEWNLNLLILILQTDKASMLDEVIDYLKQLQAQVQMMSRMNMPALMLPVALQQQLQLSMMSSMGMGMGMGMGMDMNMNTMGRPNLPGISPAVLHPNPFMTMAQWDGSGTVDCRLQPQMAAVIPDPLSQFFACQSQVCLYYDNL